METILFEIIIIVSLVFLNGFFALSEIALLSVKKNRLKQLVKQGSKKAGNALSLARHPSEMLSTIQIGITLIGIVAGVFGGATVAERIDNFLQAFPLLADYGEPISIFLVIIVVTYLSLIIGELVPKQIALAHPEKLSMKVAGLIKFFMKITKPLVWLLSLSSAKILKLLRIKPSSENVITEEEIKLLIAEGVETGAFERAEQKMVENIFHIGNQPIRDFMTAKQEIIWLNINDSVSEIKNKISSSDRATFLVYKNKPKNVLGAVTANDILAHSIDNDWENLDLEKIIQPIVSLSADLSALIAIEKLRSLSINMALIKDKESGEVVGFISFHDILEAIVGSFKISQ